MTAATRTSSDAAPRSVPDAAARSSDDRRSQRRLAYLLIAPAVILMLAVTAYPIIYAVWLSLQRYNLASPADTKFIWFQNYQTILTDRYWWTAFVITVVITVISVVIEFALGMALALVMHRTIFGKGLVRTAILIPYGIVTVGAGESHVLNVCISPTMQGRGYGRRMMKKLMEVAKSHHAEMMILEVRPSNPIAIKLYHDLGFNEIGTRKGYYPAKKGREDAIVMARMLSEWDDF